MQNLYKETMRKIINQQAEKLYDKLCLSPDFDVKDVIKN